MAPPSEVVIAVLGVTGAGKSSLIQRITQRSDIYIENGLSSGTQEVQPYKFRHKNTNFILIDTPGFNDSRHSTDSEVISTLLSWLSTSYSAGTLLNGLIYLHPISNPRMAGSAMKNLSMFRKLVGSSNFGNVVLGTTFWGSVSESVGVERERELKASEEMWGPMVRKGSRVVRVLEERGSNLEILEGIARGCGKMVVDAQKEMSGGVSREEVAAALEFGRAVLREQQRKERAQEQMRLREEERRRVEARQRELAAVRAETAKRERIEREKREREERVWRERMEKEREEQLMRERVQREAMRAEAARLQALAEQAAKKQRAEEEKRKYFRDYICEERYVVYEQRCSRCRGHLNKKKSYYYHCCFCSYDNYNLCSNCGSRCLDSSHPPMKSRPTVDKDSCIVM